ncbi:RIB43A-like with coiled-coils protein 2 [Paramacrobiotus metropolitanus]|uniref:RIB43A-like with coiled-coils protein 2 n=1 Tax=Paramacrobiotus metropolitanus TaxID=2943436 RepID=UPI0024459F6B|nr:RIB43A-like with coiled-coils protein 2 [Paramacrobiotus metropolitanus]
MALTRPPTQQELKWETMRRNFEARRSRILHSDPRIANITIKKEDIDAQMMQHQRRMDTDRQEALSLQSYLQQLDQLHYAEMYRARQAERSERSALTNYRQSQQKQESRLVLEKHASPQPYHHKDTSVQGPSAMINFDGFRYMDPHIPLAKKKLQRSMLDEQVRQQANEREKANDLESLLERKEIQLGRTADNSQRRLLKLHKKDEISTFQQNLQQSQEDKILRRAKRDEEWKRDEEEISFWTHGSFLNEQPKKFDKFRRTDWRGETKEQLQQMYSDVQYQQDVKRQQKAKESRNELDRVQFVKEQERFAKFSDHEALKNKGRVDQQLNQDNILKGLEDRARNEHFRKNIYGFNQPSEHFWDQFGRSGR